MAVAPLTRVDASGSQTDQDLVPVEAPLTIEAGGVSLGLFLRTPGDDLALATGLLFAEGIIRSAGDILAHTLAVDADEASAAIRVTLAPQVVVDAAALARSGVATTACGLCGRLTDQLGHNRPEKNEIGTRFSETSPDLVFDLVSALPQKLRAAQQVFAETGGLHAAGFFTTDGTLVDLAEDVGRHNAVDKIVGRALVAGRLPATDLILVVSGRVAFEIVQKAAMAGVKTLVAIGAPTSLAVKAARDAGLQLIGFARDGRFNRYA